MESAIQSILYPFKSKSDDLGLNLIFESLEFCKLRF